MQEKIISLLEQLNPKSSDLEKLLGLNSGTLYSYTRKSNKRNMPDDVQKKLIKYLLTCADFVKSELSDIKEQKEIVHKYETIKKSNNPALVKDKNRYYPDGSGFVHFCINTDYYMTNESECTIDGKTYEFNPLTKIPGIVSEKYIPTVRPKIDLPTATIIPPLVLSTQIHRYDDIADETAL